MKKSLLFILMCLSSVLLFAEKLTEQKSVNTKYGTFTAVAKSEISFYENGNVKSFYIKEDILAETPCGKVVVTSAQNTPVTFYEDGSLESGYIPYFRSKDYDSDVNILKTSVGPLVAKKEKPIFFWPDGTPKSFYIAENTKITEQEILARNSIIAFHENGVPSEITYANSITLSSFVVKASKPMYINDQGQIFSFTVDKGSKILIGNTDLPLESDSTLTFYENFTPKQFTIDLTGIEADIGSFHISYKNIHEVLNAEYYDSFSEKTRGDDLSILVTYYENGNIESLQAVEPEYAHYTYLFDLDMDDFYISCSSISCYEDGSLKSIILTPSLITQADKNHMVYLIQGIFMSPDQSKQVTLCTERNELLQGTFKDERKNCLVLPDNKKIYDNQLNLTTQIQWENNKPVSYSYSKYDSFEDKYLPVEKKIK